MLEQHNIEKKLTNDEKANALGRVKIVARNIVR